jgi:uncharacterized membrane protein
MLIYSYIITFSFLLLTTLSACNFQRDKNAVDFVVQREQLIGTTLDYNLLSKMVFAKCQRCHGGFDEQPDLATYEDIKFFIQDVAKMVLVEKKMPPKRATQLTQCEKDLLALWIDRGVLKNSDEATPSIPSCGN